MSIDHGKVLAKLLELASQLERNANIDFNNPHFTQGRREAYRDSAKQIRALAQPAEAVCDHRWVTDGIGPTACSRCGVRSSAQTAEAVEGAGNWVRVGSHFYRLRDGGEDDELAVLAADGSRDPTACGERANYYMRRIADHAHDAAQGAVARVARRSDPDQGTYLVAEWLGPLPEPGELLFTHSQAAPAQEIEAEPASCVEADGCPTEMAVLQRFWRQQRAAPAQGDGWKLAPVEAMVSKAQKIVTAMWAAWYSSDGASPFEPADNLPDLLNQIGNTLLNVPEVQAANDVRLIAELAMERAAATSPEPRS